MTRAAAQQLSAIQGNFPNFTTQLSQCDRQSERWLRLINEVLMIQLVTRCYVSGFKGSLPHLPSSFSSKTGLLEELLAPILFFHLPQWNIDDQIAFLASWRETTALCWTRSSNDRKHNHTFHPPSRTYRLRYCALFIRYLFVRQHDLKVVVNLVYRINVSHTDWTVEYFTQRHTVVTVGDKNANTRHEWSIVFRSLSAEPKDFVEAVSTSSVKLETLSVQETRNRDVLLWK